MNKIILLAIVSLFTIAVPSSVFADHGTNSSGGPCATDDGATAVGYLYVGNGVTSDIYVYEESNGVDGLQRGSDPSQIIPDFPDIGDCTHPDTIIV